MKKQKRRRRLNSFTWRVDLIILSYGWLSLIWLRRLCIPWLREFFFGEEKQNLSKATRRTLAFDLIFRFLLACTVFLLVGYLQHIGVGSSGLRGYLLLLLFTGLGVLIFKAHDLKSLIPENLVKAFRHLR